MFCRFSSLSHFSERLLKCSQKSQDHPANIPLNPPWWSLLAPFLIIIWIYLYNLRAYPIDQYPCRTRQAASIMLMIMNNLDPAVAQVSFNTHNLHETTLYSPVWFTLCCSRLQSETTVMITELFFPPPFQFPQELVTYGGNGQVFSNWAQVRPLIQIMSFE